VPYVPDRKLLMILMVAKCEESNRWRVAVSRKM